MISNKTIYREWKQNKKVSQKCFKKTQFKLLSALYFILCCSVCTTNWCGNIVIAFVHTTCFWKSISIGLDNESWNDFSFISANLSVCSFSRKKIVNFYKITKTSEIISKCKLLIITNVWMLS